MRAGRATPDPAPTSSPLAASVLAPDAAVATAATAGGTRRHAARFEGGLAADFFRALPAPTHPDPGVTVSSLGLGTYLGE